MNTGIIQNEHGKGNPDKLERYDHYLALDWSKHVMDIARLTPAQRQPQVLERPTDLKELRMYLGTFRGSKILTIEETSTAHWLYCELRGLVDRIIVCDPYRNRLLSEGPKTDKIDAAKLCLLLRAGMLKEVFHRDDEIYHLRRLVSAYEDVVKTGVRTMNQASALLLAEGISTDAASREDESPVSFALAHMEKHVQLYETTRAAYQTRFAALCRTNSLLRAQTHLDGIGVIGAVKIVANVIDARRFPRDAHYLSYCGLVKLVKESGQRSYGYRSPRFNHTLKSVYKTAAITALGGSNPMREYYEYLLGKGVAPHNARHSVARQIAKISYGMLKHGTDYQPKQYRRSEPVTS